MVSPDCRMKPVERDEAEPIVAARGQPALAPQLDQDALAVGGFLRQHAAGG